MFISIDKLFLRLAAYGIALLLIACDSSIEENSSGGSTDDAGSNQAPSVNAGSDQTVNEGISVNLNGTASDSDGSIASYQWAQISGNPSVAIDNYTSASASFTAPDVNSDTTLVFQLTATDDAGASASDSVSITIQNSTQAANQPPSVSAGSDQTVYENTGVNLLGIASDSDGSIASYQWAQISGSPLVGIENNTSANASFTAPDVDSDTTLVFQLTVTDNAGDSASDSVSIIIQNSTQASNQPPSVSVGSDQAVYENTTVDLTGVASDSDGSIASYQWLQTSGSSTVAIDNNTSASASFTAPEVDSNTTLVFQLTVTDDAGDSASDSVSITVQDGIQTGNQLPSVNAGSDQSVYENITVDLTGVASDSDGSIASYQWLQTSGSPTVAIDNNTSASASFTAPDVDSNTTLVFQLTVTDDAGASASDSVSITVLDSVQDNNQAPSVNAGNDQTVDENSDVSLTGVAVDGDGSIASYQWAQTSGSPTVAIDNNTSASASFTAPDVDSDTTLEFQLTATDDDGDSASDSVTIIIKHIPAENQLPQARISVTPQNPLVGEIITLDGGQSSDPDEGDELDYSWTQPSGQGIDLSADNVAAPTFTPSAAGTYSFTLTVSDGTDQASADTEVVVSAANQEPEVSLGADLSVDEREEIELAADASDSDDDPLTYTWLQLNSEANFINFSGDQTAAITFTTPEIATEITLTFSVEVEDGRGGSASDEINVIVKAEEEYDLVFEVNESNGYVSFANPEDSMMVNYQAGDDAEEYHTLAIGDENSSVSMEINKDNSLPEVLYAEDFMIVLSYTYMEADDQTRVDIVAHDLETGEQTSGASIFDGNYFELHEQIAATFDDGSVSANNLSPMVFDAVTDTLREYKKEAWIASKVGSIVWDAASCVGSAKATLLSIPAAVTVVGAAIPIGLGAYTALQCASFVSSIAQTSNSLMAEHLGGHESQTLKEVDNVFGLMSCVDGNVAACASGVLEGWDESEAFEDTAEAAIATNVSVVTSAEEEISYNLENYTEVQISISSAYLSLSTVFIGSERDIYSLAFNRTNDALLSGEIDLSYCRGVYDIDDCTSSDVQNVRLWDFNGNQIYRHMNWFDIGDDYYYDDTWVYLSSDYMISDVHHIAFSPDGSTYAIIGEADIHDQQDSTYSYTDGAGRQITIWDASDGTRIKKIFEEGSTGDTSSGSALVYTKDGERLIAGYDNGSVVVWDVDSGTKITEKEQHASAVNAVALAPDGNSFATASADNSIKLWDLSTVTPYQTLFDHNNNVTDISYSPDGSLLASSSWDDTVKIWDALSGELVRTLTSADGYLYDARELAFIDNDHLATITSLSTGSLSLWHISTGTHLGNYTGNSGRLRAVAASSDGRYVAAAGDDHQIRLWAVLDASNIPQAAPDLSYSVVGADLKDINLFWSAVDNATYYRVLDNSQSYVYEGSSLSYTHENRYVTDSHTYTVSGCNLHGCGPASEVLSIDLSEPPSGAYLSLSTVFIGSERDIYSLAFNRTNDALLSGEIDLSYCRGVYDIDDCTSSDVQNVRLWDFNGNQIYRHMNWFDIGDDYYYDDTWVYLSSDYMISDVHHIAFSPDGSTYAIIGEADIHDQQDSTYSYTDGAGRQITIWDASDGTRIKKIFEEGSTGDTSSGSALVYTKDGERLIAGYDNGSVVVWDVDSGTKITEKEQHASAVNAVALAPDGNSFATASADNSIKLWDLSTVTPYQTLFDHNNNVTDISYSPDGSLLASSSWDDTVKIWDALSGELVRTLTSADGYLYDARELAFIDNDHLATITSLSTGSLSLWHISTGTHLGNYTGNSGRLRSVAASSDGKYVAAAGDDNQIRLWNVNGI